MGGNSLAIMAAQYYFFRLFDSISMRLWNFSIWHYVGTVKALFLSIITIGLILFFIHILKNKLQMSKIIKLFGIK